LKDHLPSGLKLVVMTDAAHMPTSSLELHCYEDLIAPHPTEYDWPDLPEDWISQSKPGSQFVFGDMYPWDC